MATTKPVFEVLTGATVGAGGGRIRLCDLPPTHCGIVTDVEAEGGVADQLKSMGVCNGRKLEVVKHGDPLILKVLATRIGISARLAALVYVESCSGGQCVTK